MPIVYKLQRRFWQIRMTLYLLICVRLNNRSVKFCVPRHSFTLIRNYYVYLSHCRYQPTRHHCIQNRRTSFYRALLRFCVWVIVIRIKLLEPVWYHRSGWNWFINKIKQIRLCSKQNLWLLFKKHVTAFPM